MHHRSSASELMRIPGVMTIPRSRRPLVVLARFPGPAPRSACDRPVGTRFRRRGLRRLDLRHQEPLRRERWRRHLSGTGVGEAHVRRGRRLGLMRTASLRGPRARRELVGDLAPSPVALIGGWAKAWRAKARATRRRCLVGKGEDAGDLSTRPRCLGARGSGHQFLWSSEPNDAAHDRWPGQRSAADPNRHLDAPIGTPRPPGGLGR